jgi:hypothetical protein
MTIDRVWAMPNRWTFTIPPIARLLKEEMGQGVWADPFAGNNSPAALTNDINPLAKANSHQDALDFLRSLPDHSVDGVLFDPPYSFRQASECYKMVGLQAAKVTSKKYWSECKDEVARIIRLDGKAICFGWTSMGLGNRRGFNLTRVLLVPHGGSMNDTIVTVERKVVSQCALLKAA